MCYIFINAAVVYKCLCKASSEIKFLILDTYHSDTLY
jgi:hypothetical protein